MYMCMCGFTCTYVQVYIHVCTYVHTCTYLKEGKEEFNEFGGQSLIIVANGELVQATDSIVPTRSKTAN